MHDGVLPGTFSARVVAKVPNLAATDEDMKKANRRHSPKLKSGRTSFVDWLRLRARAEEEETWDDINDDDVSELESDDYEDPEDESCGYEDDDEDEPEEFDDFEEEKELEFDDEDHERAPFPLPDLNDEEDEDNIPSGRFMDFYRMEQGEEEEEDTPGGFEPGQAVGTIGGMGSDVPKIERARILMRQLVNNPNVTREDIIEQFIKRLPTTEETAKSYYEDIAREMGLNQKDEEGMGAPGGTGDDEEGAVDQLPGDTTQELSQEEIDAQDPNAQGVIRTVPNAHLVFKRQMEDGTFEELWIYNIGDAKDENKKRVDGSKLEDSLNIRREILSGTDIPRGHTRSENGDQSYTLHTMGNAQLLHIVGLAN